MAAETVMEAEVNGVRLFWAGYYNKRAALWGAAAAILGLLAWILGKSN